MLLFFNQQSSPQHRWACWKNTISTAAYVKVVSKHWTTSEERIYHWLSVHVEGHLWQWFKKASCRLLLRTWSWKSKGKSWNFSANLLSRPTMQNLRDKSLHRGFCTSETRIWARILLNEFRTSEFRTRILGSNFWS